MGVTRPNIWIRTKGVIPSVGFLLTAGEKAVMANERLCNRVRSEIVSSLTNITVRKDVAMTGEVTITGQVLPIGGLKEKLLAAHRAGIKEVIIPKENEKDLVDMPKKIIDEVKITPVEYADQVLKIALTKELKRTEWVEVDLSKKDDKSQASIQ